uniref:NAD(P)-binding domain-containing protein n=1 Tax=Kalanchoe fedtschenkoi TaxID=63787 RepID=A0A7N0UIT6_KALFE
MQTIHPCLTSYTFLLTPTTPRSSRTSRLTVASKKSGPFPSFRKQSAAEENGADESTPTSQPNPFDFLNKFAGRINVKSLIPVVNTPSGGVLNRRKDPGTVFVAGAAGLTGARIAQALIRQGFNVRAGVPDLGAAVDLARLAADYKIISPEESKKLNVVESSFNDAVSIAKAIGNAGKVVVTIGPSENGPSADISTADALQVIEASQLAGVGHVAVIYNDGAPSASANGPLLAGISNFFSNIFSKSRSLSIGDFMERVVRTDVKFTLIKTRLAEDYAVERGYNVVVAAEGLNNDFKVAKAQIASVVGDVFSNVAVAENKVVEVFTDPSAPARPVSELFSLIPEDGRRQAYAEAAAAAKAEEEALLAAQKAVEAAEAAKKLEEEVQKLSAVEAKAASLADEAQKKAAEAGASLESIMSKSKGIGKDFTWDKLSAQVANAVPKFDDKPDADEKVQVATVRGRAKAQSLPPQKAVVKRSPPPPAKAAPVKEEKKAEVRKVFGGLFKQETIYIDDD